MAPSDGSEDTSLQGELSQDIEIAEAEAEDDETNASGEATNEKTFHRYVNLPHELRAIIRTAAIDDAAANSEMSRVWRRGPDVRDNISRLGAISKEWQKDVERETLSVIEVDPSIDEELSKFKEVFTTKKRRSFLKALDIWLDQGYERPAWHNEMDMMDVALALGKTGHLFQYVNSWWLDGDAKDLSALSMTFHIPLSVSAVLGPTENNSLWRAQVLERVTGFGNIPSTVATWAVRCEFPLSFKMVTCLSFTLDFVPLAVAQAIIKTMPNLTECKFGLAFNGQSELAWRTFTDFVRCLPTLAPSLRMLRLRGQGFSSTDDSMNSCVQEFSTTLRDYSQRLDCLCIDGVILHQVFFQPFSEEHGLDIAMTKWQWPKMREVQLQFSSKPPFSDPDRVTVTPADILIAAGRAAMAMPVLEKAYIKVKHDREASIRGLLSAQSESRGANSVELLGFDEDEDQRILAAWAPSLRWEARLIEQREREDGLITRAYRCSP